MVLRGTLTAVPLAASVALAGISGASATTAKVSLTCGLPTRGLVRCRLAGSGFRPHEHLRVTYRVEFTALPLKHGKYPMKVYRRDGRTDATGAFRRPPLGFTVVKYHESYRVTATVLGDAADHAGITVVGIAQ